jgi:serine/threonine protein kinase
MIYVHHAHNSDRGSFAVVTPALDVDDETGACRQVAVKRVRPRSEFPSGEYWDELHHSADRLFERERRIWPALERHPGIVPALRATRIDGEPVLLLEYIYGPTLDEILAGPHGPLHPVDILDLAEQVAMALRHLHHTCRVSHGDISPQNILYDGTGSIQLSDFSLAAPFGDNSTVPSSLNLTFQAPEEKHALRVTPAVDIWKAALCILLACRGESPSLATTANPDFCGRRTYKADVSFSVERFVEDLNDGTLQASISRFLLRALSPDPDQRFQDGGEFADAVRQLRSTNTRWSDLLEEQREMRQQLCSWRSVSPVSEQAALNDLQILRARLLSSSYVSGAHRVLYDKHFLLARAAWLSLKRQNCNPELLDFARSMAQTSVNIFDGDPRPLEIVIQASRALRESSGVVDLRNGRDLVRLFTQFKTFVRAHQVRQLQIVLTQVASTGNQEATALLQEARVALAEFDEKLAHHYARLEIPLVEQLF